MEYLGLHENNRKVNNIDLDHTIAVDYSLTEAHSDMIETIRTLHYTYGHIIIIWTARLWEDAPDIVAFLIKNRIPFHGLMCNKGGADYYTDDKAMTPKELIFHVKMMEEDRLQGEDDG